MLFNPLILFVIFIFIFILLIEFKHRVRPLSPLRLRTINSHIKKNTNKINIKIDFEIRNTHKRMEVMIPDLRMNMTFLDGNYFDNIKVISSINTNHPDQDNRTDGYWPAYIVKAGFATYFSIEINLVSEQEIKEEFYPECIWLKLNWINYGPFGKLERFDSLVIPLSNKITNINSFKSDDIYKLLPIKTHILGVLDDPINICSSYTKGILKKGDILTIGETPLAVMQGRYLDPNSLSPDFLARLLCYFFHPTSSLANACGMQALINIIGPTRVIIAWTLGSIFKVIGIKGMFYRLAGKQARLIDDITGTTPPYDKTIVLGPLNANLICKEISNELGIEVAVVDVNDLNRVKILASSNKHINIKLENALINNPAGNGNQQTPLVLVRPS